MSFTVAHLANAFAELEVEDKRVAWVYLSPAQAEYLTAPEWEGAVTKTSLQGSYASQGRKIWGAKLGIRDNIPSGCVILASDDLVEQIVQCA